MTLWDIKKPRLLAGAYIDAKIDLLLVLWSYALCQFNHFSQTGIIQLSFLEFSQKPMG